MRLKLKWDRQFKATKLENQKTILEFERTVQDSPRYKAYLAQDRRWLQMARGAEAEYRAALQRWNSHREEFEKAKNEEGRLLGKLQEAWTGGDQRQ